MLGKMDLTTHRDGSMMSENNGGDDDDTSSENNWSRSMCKVVVNFLLFYTTAFFVLLAIVSIFALIFLVPFFIDPAWSTLQADFDPEGTRCTTIAAIYLKGRQQHHY